MKFLVLTDGARISERAILEVEAAAHTAGVPGGLHAVHYVRGDETRIAECTAYELMRFLEND